MDIFGNRVDDEGQSYDEQGRTIDPTSYVRNWAGEITMDENRDHEYTREAGRRVAEELSQNNVILSTQLFAYVMFRYLVHINPRLDLYQLIRIGAREARIQRTELIQIVDRFKKLLSEQEKNGFCWVPQPSKRNLLNRS